MLLISLSVNIDKYPKNSFLSGVHISLHSQGKRPKASSSLIAFPGEIILVHLKKIVDQYLNSSSVESFDSKLSSLGSMNFDNQWGQKNDTIVIAFTYQDLSVTIIRELPPYTILSFLSETGGMLGLLLGSSLVNLFIFLLQWGWGLRFNELNWSSVQNLPTSNNDSETEKVNQGNNTLLLFF